ncbi:amidohydrolase family protein [Sphingomonas oryzagri]|uniref:Amidohydrolase family protein n=1 Tax=Sphingomonas oryzagri TaxID=3042314 RepID=A0ABT6MXK2_9SPHN|nr:amidohydrolase family protein [Sphingomonas oryzagri]MDH7637726.1 amidohydrolase family protein [Sphingomonas oryzagri]
MRGASAGILALLLAGSAMATVPTNGIGSDGRTQQAPGQSLPMQPARTIRIHAHSGTWMSLDISRDGRRLLFDMLGDLYTMPLSGGPARQLTQGLGFDTQPTFSPDGRSILFVSDRSGADNLWVADADGGHPRQISFGDDDAVLVSPAWAADGRSVFVSRYRADLNNVELWRYGLDGSAELLVPIQPNADAPRSAWQSALGAVAAPDGEWLYYAKRIGGIDFDEVDSWTIVRRDLKTGRETSIVAGAGSRGADHDTAFRPALSPDGRLLAYEVRTAGQTRLRLRDLVTGTDRLLAAPLDPDQLEASLWQDIMPRYAFTPDGKAIVISRAGGFDRIALDGGATRRLALDADMRVDVGPSTRHAISDSSGPVKARLIQAPVASPDGQRLAYMALGGLYVQAAVDGAAPRRLPTGADIVAEPGWSPDGTWLTYVSWSEEAGGTVWMIKADGSGPPKAVSRLPAFYTAPAFTPDGTRILAFRSAQAARQQTNFEFPRVRDAELVEMSVAGGDARVVTHGEIGGRPQFVGGGQSVTIKDRNGLIAVDLATGATHPVARILGPGWYFMPGSVPADDLRISPGGRYLLAGIAQQLFLVEVPEGGKVADLTDPALPKRRITTGGVDYFEWGAGDEIQWSVGSSFRREPLSAVLPLATGAPALPPSQPPAIAMNVEVPRAVPEGKLLLRGARVLTMAQGDRIIDDADILVDHDRIAAVGPRGSFTLPADTTIRDVTGKVIVPGFIDEHDHIGEIRRDVLSTEDWGLRARLAYGVTTSFDPSTLSIDMLSYQDMLDAGLMTGPRLRSTGMAIFSMNRFASLDQVRAVQQRYRQDYGLGNIKEYRTGNRRVREWMAMAAREEGLQPTTEGALSMKLDLSQILDGFAGNEHALAAAPLGDDVIGLLVAMHTSYSTTLMVTNGGPEASDWFIVHRNPSEDAKIRQFWTPPAIEQKLIDRPGLPLQDYRFQPIAADAARVAKAGGLVGMGAHGEVPGIGFHWEMEAHAMGGMTPMAILHAATAGSAETIGRLADLGTIEPGKLADLVVLDRDPLADIRNTTSIDMVMRGGFLYLGSTLDELWPQRVPLAEPWFRRAAPDQWLPSNQAP